MLSTGTEVEYRYSLLLKARVLVLQSCFSYALPLISNERGQYMYKSHMKNVLYLAAKAKLSNIVIALIF